MSVSKKRVLTKRTTLHFFFFGENGERFPLLLETNNAFRIVTQTYFSDITKISGNMTQVSGDMTSGEMTLGRLDRLPLEDLGHLFFHYPDIIYFAK